MPQNLSDSLGNNLNVANFANTPSGGEALEVATTKIDNKLNSYTAAINILLPQANATDIFSISGSATKTIKVQKIAISATASTTQVNNLTLIYRTSLSSGGTSSTLTNVAFDSNNISSTALVQAYTANPTILGTTAGTIRNGNILLATQSAPSTMLWNFTDSNTQPFVLRGTASSICVNLLSQNLAGGNYDIYVDWIEA